MFSSFSRNIAILLVAFLFALTHKVWLWGFQVGIGYTLFIILILGSVLGFIFMEKKTLDKRVILLASPILFFALMLSIRSSELLVFLNMVMIYILFMLIALDYTTFSMKLMTIGGYIKTFFLPVTRLFTSACGLIGDIFHGTNLPKHRQLTGKILTGLIISLPLLFLFITLFIAADSVFSSYISRIFTFEISIDMVWDILQVILPALFLAGFYRYTILDTPSLALEDEKYKGEYQVEFSVVAGMLNLLFFTFIIIQIGYLFGSSLPLGNVTYSDYARSGFWELLCVIILVFFTIRTGGLYINKKNLSYKSFSILFIIQTCIIACSAWKRMYMYESMYGLTTLRLYVQAFIILLIILLGFLAYQIIQEKRREVFVFGTFVSSVIFLAFMNLINPDRIITEYNMKNMIEPDIPYSVSLGNDGIVTLGNILRNEDSIRRIKFVANLNPSTVLMEGSYPLVSWNLARQRAGEIAREFTR